MDIDEPEPKQKESKSRKIQLNKNQKAKMFIATAKTTISTNVIRESQLKPSNNNVGATSLLFIPRQVHKSYTKVLTKNQSGEKDVLETGCMMDLANTLPNT